MLAIIWNSQYFGARDNYVRAKIWCARGKSKELRHQTKTRGLLHGTSVVFLFPSSTGLINIYFFHYNFPINIQKHPLIFVFMTFCISRIMNAKKISKFEREEKSNGNPLLHHGIFVSFHEKFPIYIQKDSLYFFFCAVFVFSE